MKLCWFDDYRLGLVQGEFVLDVSAALDGMPRDAYPALSGDPLITHLDRLLPAIAELAGSAATIPVSEARFLSPVARPTKIIGTPANYVQHVEEAASAAEVFTTRYSGPIMEQGLFLKAISSLVGPSQGISLRFPERLTHHEMELGVVIGKQGSNIPESEALEYIAGYTIALDITVRGPEDRSFRKSIDSYAVLGPWLVLADEISDPGNLAFSLSVNGEIRQASNTRYMILDIATQIAWASRFYTLWPGDTIMTGTCEGVGRIAPGDVLHCWIEHVGATEVQVR
ncbi:MAG: fumarylacetoacetate hydrolase family protein [Gammaproteobacteria bacterium]|nr:fumarylacetoacetate hydrolase family protein [Gammaproteobacteria bacterium]